MTLNNPCIRVPGFYSLNCLFFLTFLGIYFEVQEITPNAAGIHRYDDKNEKVILVPAYMHFHIEYFSYINMY